MKNIFTFLFIFWGLAHYGQNTLLVENFDYDAGVQLRDNGWNPHSGVETNPISVSSDGLSLLTTDYAGNGKGRAALVINNGADENKPFSSYVPQPADGESPVYTYASFLVKPNGEIPEATGNIRPYFFHLGQYQNAENPDFSSLSTAFRARTFIYPGTLPNTFRLNLSFNENVPDEANLTGNLNSNNTHLVVVKYTSIAGPDNDEVSLYVFKDGDDISSEPASPTIGPLKGTNQDVTLQAVSLRQYQEGQNVIVDGFIVRDHWDMTSDPSNVYDVETVSDIKIYPNPALGSWVNIISKSTSPMHITVNDIEGRPVMQSVLIDKSLDVSRLTKGVYIVRVKQDNKTYSQKLLLH